MKIIRKIKTTKAVVDKLGWTIPKDTTLLVLADMKNPYTNQEEMAIRKRVHIPSFLFFNVEILR